jgi:uncharacterized membrane-anchored protein
VTTQTSTSLIPENENPPLDNRQKRKVGAIILAVFLVGIGIAVFIVGGIGAIFMTDSCSGESIGTVWEIWVVIVWPLLMLAGALLPSFLYLKNKRWPVIMLTILGCAVINTAWYFSLGYALTAAGC